MKKIILISFILLLSVFLTGCIKQSKNNNSEINAVQKVVVGDLYLGADSGYKSPTATGGKYNTYTNPTYAYSSNDQYAFFLNVDLYTIRYQSYETFNFGIPAGATIEGVQISIEHYEENYDSGDRIYTSWWSASDNAWSSNSTNHTKVASDTIEEKGGAEDLWGRTPTVDDFSNENFSVRVSLQDAVNEDVFNFFLDHIQVKVYYTEAPANTCTPPASGDWYVSASDNCYVATDTYIIGSLHLLNDKGQGSFNIIDNAVLSVQKINSTSTPINVESGGKIKFWTAL